MAPSSVDVLAVIYWQIVGLVARELPGMWGKYCTTLKSLRVAIGRDPPCLRNDVAILLHDNNASPHTA